MGHSHSNGTLPRRRLFVGKIGPPAAAMDCDKDTRRSVLAVTLGASDGSSMGLSTVDDTDTTDVELLIDGFVALQSQHNTQMH